MALPATLGWWVSHSVWICGVEVSLDFDRCLGVNERTNGTWNGWFRHRWYSSRLRSTILGFWMIVAANRFCAVGKARGNIEILRPTAFMSVVAMVSDLTVK